VHEAIDVPWRTALVTSIDDAAHVARDLQQHTALDDSDQRLVEQTIAFLITLRRKTIGCHLAPPNGITTLGLARAVTDTASDALAPLVRAVGLIERNYLTAPADVGDYPILPPLTVITIHADGSTTPAVPDGQAMITVQEHDVVHVGIWRRTDFGGHTEAPVNQAALLELARAVVQRDASQLLLAAAGTSVICPSGIVDLMVWPEDVVA
jgi:hypothetical protein